MYSYADHSLNVIQRRLIIADTSYWPHRNIRETVNTLSIAPREISLGVCDAVSYDIGTMTTATTPEVRFTPADVLRLEDEGLFELVEGKLTEKTMSSLANETAGIVILRLGVYREQSRAGKVYPEQSFQCFPHDPELIRRPDVAFILTERLSGVDEEGHVKIAPDLAVEVVSPNDKVYELEEKLRDYRSAGVKLIWVVNPKFRLIHVHKLGLPVVELRENDAVGGESVLPGFSVAVRDLLPEAPGSRVA